MLDWLFPSTEVSVPLAVPLPVVLERLKSACQPPPWHDRIFLAYPVCRLTDHELILRRSNTWFGLGLVQFRAPVNLASRQLRGIIQATPSAKVFLTLWTLLWSTTLVITVTKSSDPTGTAPPLPRWASWLFFLTVLGVVPLLARSVIAEHHPHRKLIMNVLHRAASANAA